MTQSPPTSSPTPALPMGGLVRTGVRLMVKVRAGGLVTESFWAVPRGILPTRMTVMRGGALPVGTPVEIDLLVDGTPPAHLDGEVRHCEFTGIGRLHTIEIDLASAIDTRPYIVADSATPPAHPTVPALARPGAGLPQAWTELERLAAELLRLARAAQDPYAAARTARAIDAATRDLNAIARVDAA